MKDFTCDPFVLKERFIIQCQYISTANAQERRYTYILSRMPLPCERTKRFRFPLRQTSVVARERKAEHQKNVFEEYAKGVYEIKSCDEWLVYSYRSKWTLLDTGVNRVHRAWSVEKNHPPFSNYFNYKDEPIRRVYFVSGVP